MKLVKGDIAELIVEVSIINAYRKKIPISPNFMLEVLIN